MELIKKIGKNGIFVALAVIVLLEFLWANMGHAIWIVISSLIIIVLSIVIIKKNKIKTLSFILLGISLAIPLLLSIGSADRNLTHKEKKYVLEYLEKRYGNKEFKIKNAKISNEKLTGFQNMFQFVTFDWSLIDIEATDDAGHAFNIIGHNEGFNNILALTDNYDAISSVYEYNPLYDNNISDVTANIWESYWEKKKPPYDYYITMEIIVDYSDHLKTDFNETRESDNFQKIKQAILKYGFCSDIRMTIKYKMKDGAINYGGKNFHYE